MSVSLCSSGHAQQKKLDRDVKPCIITFLGPVGVGKSTQMELLERYLQSENAGVIRTYIKSSHVFAHFLSSFLKTLGASEEISYCRSLTRTYPRRALMVKLFSLYALLDTISIILKFLLMVQIPFSLGFTILIEEGLHMTSHTYVFAFPLFFNSKPKNLPFLARLQVWINRRNHVNLVLDARDDSLSIRRKSRSFRQNELPEYVSAQKKWMRRLDPHDTVFLETSNQPIMRVHKKIVKELELRCRDKAQVDRAVGGQQ
jgi:energy-coupling factor transporter ATP-binding protein EcfA2